MVVKSTHSGCYFLAGQVTYLLCASVLLIGKGGVLTVPSGIDVVCHTDRPSRLRHLCSQLQEGWLLTAHTESLPGMAFNQRKLYCPRVCLPLGQPLSSDRSTVGTKVWLLALTGQH